MKYLIYWSCPSLIWGDRSGTKVVDLPMPIQCEDDLQAVKDFLLTTQDFRPFEHTLVIRSFSRFEQ